jgi:hypothetical protein
MDSVVDYQSNVKAHVEHFYNNRMATMAQEVGHVDMSGAGNDHIEDSQVEYSQGGGGSNLQDSFFNDPAAAPNQHMAMQQGGGSNLEDTFFNGPAAGPNRHMAMQQDGGSMDNNNLPQADDAAPDAAPDAGPNDGDDKAPDAGTAAGPDAALNGGGREDASFVYEDEDTMNVEVDEVRLF